MLVHLKNMLIYGGYGSEQIKGFPQDIALVAFVVL